MITEFKYPYRWLSNFQMCQIEYEGVIYPSTEHAYQAAKTLDIKLRQAIAKLSTPGEAKKYANKIKLRDNWDKIKEQVMYDVCKYKFTMHPDLKAKLLSTNEEELIEGNYWGDTYWGECPLGNGQNKLGKILMRIRNEIRN